MDRSIATPTLSRGPIGWLVNQPYLMLSLTSLFWAGNIVIARYTAGHIPPITLNGIRWFGACLVLLPFAWPHLRRDWPVLRAHWPLLLLLSATGFAYNNTLAFWGLNFTQALNALLLQSSGPLFVALWSLVLFRVRLTPMQLLGITISLGGVLTIILRGDLLAIADVKLNRGDLMLAGSMLVFGIYSAMMPRRPATHPLSLIAVTAGCGSLLILPLSIWELGSGARLHFDALTVTTVVYMVIFSSALGYLFFNRGIALIGPNRAAPFFHLVPVFGSVMAIAFLGEKPEPFHIAGYLMVVAGVFIAARRQSGTI